MVYWIPRARVSLDWQGFCYMWAKLAVMFHHDMVDTYA